MSEGAQSIFFFLAFLGCLLAALWNYWDPARRSIAGFHPGWAGLAAFTFVFFWIAVHA